MMSLLQATIWFAVSAVRLVVYSANPRVGLGLRRVRGVCCASLGLDEVHATQGIFSVIFFHSTSPRIMCQLVKAITSDHAWKQRNRRAECS